MSYNTEGICHQYKPELSGYGERISERALWYFASAHWPVDLGGWEVVLPMNSPMTCGLRFVEFGDQVKALGTRSFFSTHNSGTTLLAGVLP